MYQSRYMYMYHSRYIDTGVRYLSIECFVVPRKFRETGLYPGSKQGLACRNLVTCFQEALQESSTPECHRKC